MLAFPTLLANSADDKLVILFLFVQKKASTSYANCFLRRQSALNVQPIFWENISKCHLLKFLPSMLNVMKLVCSNSWNNYSTV